MLVVLQLSGGNDYMNTVVPYKDPLYWDYRPRVALPEDQILLLDNDVGLHPSMGPIRDMYNQGKVAIIHGVGYPNSVRSHFRSMDIWHTCEPEKTGTEGWLGLATRELDPHKDNIVTAVSFGPSMFRALVCLGCRWPAWTTSTPMVSSPVSPRRSSASKILERFAQNYSPVIGTDEVMKYLGQTGLEAMEGADILKVAPQKYASTVQYPNTSIAKKLKGIAQVHFADLGSRVFYCDHLGFDTHANQMGVHATLWNDVSTAIEAFFADLREHHAADNVLMFLFTEFGRRVRDNGSGTDHGAGGVSFVIGDSVKGGQYGEYPSRKAEDLTQGDLAPGLDFRGLYSTILEDWLHVDAKPIVKGSFEKPRFL